MTSNELTVAYPGREGAHSAAACDRLFPAARVEAVPSFPDVVSAVATGRCAYGVLPIESSLSGSVSETHDLLFDSPLSIVAEAILPIRHCVAGTSRSRSTRSARSARTRRARPVPQPARIVAARPGHGGGDNRRRSGADRRARRSARRRHRQRARSPPVRADRDRRERRRPSRGVHTVRRARPLHPPRPPPRHVAHRTDVRHRPPARRARTAPSRRSASRDIDMVQLVSRPIPSTPWKYRFDAVLGGHPLDEDVSGALAEMQRETARLRVFGSLPRRLEDVGATARWPPEAPDKAAENGAPRPRARSGRARAGTGARPRAHAAAASRMKSTGRACAGGRGSVIDASSSVPVALAQVAGRAGGDDVLPDRVAAAERGTTWSSVSRPPVEPQ